MSRDQRIEDNWALLYAQQKALETNSGLRIFFYLAPSFLEASHRQYDFMLKGLKLTAENTTKYNLSFELIKGDLIPNIIDYLQRYDIKLLVTDFDPLRIKKQWKKQICDRIKIAFHEVDSHNIIPCWITSQKQEYAAYTIRKKIQRLLPDYLKEFPQLIRHPYNKQQINQNPINIPVENYYKYNSYPQPVTWIKPGTKAAKNTLVEFIRSKLSTFEQNRNDPNSQTLSNLSPYLHFGQISAARIALEIQRSHAAEKDKSAFLEELIIRRELADNFCHYNPNYDRFEGSPNWAYISLKEHIKDKRSYLYPLDSLEKAQTHDQLWNAAQMEMVIKGKMSGYMRMYWAKKILEWTPDPQTALENAIYLNDKYELDGRDPNGYAGIMWSITGIHDRPWFEREIFGKVRFMSYNGCKRKFNVKDYINRINALS